jgi:hypothetical protein
MSIGDFPMRRIRVGGVAKGQKRRNRCFASLGMTAFFRGFHLLVLTQGSEYYFMCPAVFEDPRRDGLMPFTIEIRPEGKILTATVIGDLDKSSYQSMREHVYTSLKQSGAQHVLLDLRSAVVQVSLLDVFDAASTNADIFDRSCKYAIVYSETTLPEAQVHFGESVARNRGAQFRVFLDLAPAQEWLNGTD